MMMNMMMMMMMMMSIASRKFVSRSLIQLYNPKITCQTNGLNIFTIINESHLFLAETNGIFASANTIKGFHFALDNALLDLHLYLVLPCFPSQINENLLSWGNTFPWLKHQCFEDNDHSWGQSSLSCI
jgi:hypothetical protein